MGKIVYVSQSGAKWKTSWGKDSAGLLFNSKAAALDEAKKMVNSLPEGSCVQIMIQRDNGRFQTKWTYGKDPFPPLL